VAELALNGRLPELLHGLTEFAAHHSCNSVIEPFIKAARFSSERPNGHSGLHCFEFSLKFLNLAQALADNLRILLVKLFQAVELRFVVVEACSRVANSSA